MQLDFHEVAQFNQSGLLLDVGTVRHRGKIEVVIHNPARAVKMLAHEGSLTACFWRLAPQPYGG